MGEEIEIRDVSGNLVRVPLYPTLSAIAARLGDGATVQTTPAPGVKWEVSVRRVMRPGEIGDEDG